MKSNSERKLEYFQLNIDGAYGPERLAVGHLEWGHTAGYFRYTDGDGHVEGLLIDAGLGTISSLATTVTDFSFGHQLSLAVTHGHSDHTPELSILSELHCKRSGMRKPPVSVFATAKTYEILAKQHEFAFGAGKTLQHVPIGPSESYEIGAFTMTPVAVYDHFPGAVIFALEVGPIKVLTCWDMRTLPDPDKYPILKNSHLAMVEANTWYQSAKTGHCSVEQLFDNRNDVSFLEKLDVVRSSNVEIPINLVHVSGAEDRCGLMSSTRLRRRLAEEYPESKGLVGVADRGQHWEFDV